MKTPEEIKKGMECCEIVTCPDKKCPYYASNIPCDVQVQKDALALIQQLEAQVPKWISVEDGLPEEPCAVIAVLTYGNAVCVAWYCSGWFETGSGLRFRAGKGITHWMPLPEPPKEE